MNEKEGFLFRENISNILAFIPFGILLGTSFRKIKWWSVFVIGLIVSLSIEMLQFFLKRGFSEFDDVFHNVLGCLVGFGIYKFVECIIERIRRRTLIRV